MFGDVRVLNWNRCGVLGGPSGEAGVVQQPCEE